MKNKNIISFILAMVIIVMITSSCLFIILNSNHHCIIKHCPTCYEFSIFKDKIQQIAFVFMILLAMGALLYKGFWSGFNYIYFYRHTTLITLKVKLLN